MFPFKLQVVSIPVKANFRGINFREIALFEGPAGWSEFSPFIEYSNKESSTWLKAAIEGATKEPPKPIRDQVEINATLPNVKVSEVKELLAGFNGCNTIKIKINDFETDQALLIECLKEIPKAKFRLDVNGGWALEEAIANVQSYEKAFGSLIEYIEQPCTDFADLNSLRNSTGIKIAVDESIRKYLAGDLTKIKEVADIAIIKWAPTGGFDAALEVIEKIGLPVVISSALDSSVGISHGLSLAEAVPNLYGACGLGTVCLFEGDVTSNPLMPINGIIKNRKVIPDRIEEFKAESGRQKWWQDRANAVYEGGNFE
jgi:O-succinylbenzoate synthase